MDVAQTSTLPLSEGDIIHLVSEVYKLHPRLMKLVCQSCDMSFSHPNPGETPSMALSLSQLNIFSYCSMVFLEFQNNLLFYERLSRGKFIPQLPKHKQI
jgi:hypothetical protein